jgi:hypothetical protein
MQPHLPRICADERGAKNPSPQICADSAQIRKTQEPLPQRTQRTTKENLTTVDTVIVVIGKASAFLILPMRAQRWRGNEAHQEKDCEQRRDHHRTTWL